ncbi:MAG TPA: preprotein translocase subunit SecG [Nitrospirales bacterium]|jgi:preprotein translocase subunit SecG
MYIALVILHILVAFIMVGVILLQSGKGAEIGAAFGGSSQTVFGSRGAGTFLSKMTAVAATIFMLTSLSLAILTKRLNYSSTIGLDKPISSPSTPAASPPGVPAPVVPMTDQPNAPAPAAPTKP